MIKKCIKIAGILFICILIVFTVIQSLKVHDTEFSVFVEPTENYDSIVKIYVDDEIKLEEYQAEMIFFSKIFHMDLSFGFYTVKIFMNEDLLREATIFIWTDQLIHIGIWPDECENGKCVDIDRWPKFIIEILNVKRNH